MTFERRLACRYLTHLLTGTYLSELGSRRVVKVAFQQAPQVAVDHAPIRTWPG